MSRDNVTPFRPRRSPKVAQKGPGLSSPRGKAVLVQTMTLLAFTLGLILTYLAAVLRIPGGIAQLVIQLGPTVVGVIGVLIAVANRRDGMPWAATHHEHALRTLVFGFVVMLLAGMLANLIPAAGSAVLVLNIVVMIWAVIRAAVGLVLAVLRRPIWRPTGPFL